MPAKHLFYLFHGLSLRLLFRKDSATSNKWINSFKVTKLSMLSVGIQIFFRASARNFPQNSTSLLMGNQLPQERFTSFSTFRNFLLVVSSDQSLHEAYCPLVSNMVLVKILTTYRTDAVHAICISALVQVKH